MPWPTPPHGTPAGTPAPPSARKFAIRTRTVVSRTLDTTNSVQMPGLTTKVVLSGRHCDPGSVPVRPSVPAALKIGPFTAAEARCRGVTREQLRGAGYRRLGAGLYRWVGLEESPHLLLSAVARRLPAGAAFSGWTALWLHGLQVEPCDPIEVTIPELIGRHCAGASVRRGALAAEEIVLRRGLPATSALRAVVDLGGRDPLTEGVVAADMVLHSRRITHAELRTYVAEHPRAKGIARLRRVVDLAEPKAESPMESRLRMLLVLAGLPRPEVQGPIHDVQGHPLGRPDLLYRVQRLAIEYDGGTHRDRLVDDNRRQNGLIGAGLRLLRFTAVDVYDTPDAVVMQVRRGLAEATSPVSLPRSASPGCRR